MKRLLILVFGLTLILLSCKKYGNGYVKGTVTDVSTGTPAEGVPVSVIVEISQAKGSSYSTFETVGTTSTASDGSYIINFKKKRGWQYSYKVVLGLSDKYTPEYNSENIDVKKSAFNFEVYRKAYAKLKITKTTTKSTRVEFKVGKGGLSSTVVIQTTTFTDSLVPYIFTVRGNYSSNACVIADYVIDGFKLDWCSSDQYIQIGDTALFSVTYD